MSKISMVNVRQAQEWLENNEAMLVDVRAPEEYRAEHIQGAVLNPLAQFSTKRVRLERGERKVIFQCHSGKRAEMALKRYMDEHDGGNDEEYYCLEGSLQGWKAAGLPTEKGRSVMSLERQVMTITGGLTLLGAILAITVSPVWVWLSGFVGAGMLFAGLSGNCMLKMALMKLPMNKDA